MDKSVKLTVKLSDGHEICADAETLNYIATAFNAFRTECEKYDGNMKRVHDIMAEEAKINFTIIFDYLWELGYYAD